MRFAFSIIFLLLSPSMVWSAEPFASATVKNDGKIVTGQQVLVDVEIFVPDFFKSPPQFPLFDIPNAMVTLADIQAQNISQTIDGVQYAGIRKTYAIVPEVSGAFEVPAVKIDVDYPSNGTVLKSVVTTPSLSFDVAAQGASDRQRIVFAADKLDITQSFDTDPRSLKVGDALVRTITITAEDTQAMLFPPVEAGDANGLHHYEKQARIEDGVGGRRAMKSQRSETHVYLADTKGSFAIPPVSYEWFDVSAQKTKVASLPAIQVTVAEKTAAGTAIQPMPDETAPEPPFVRRKQIAGMILLLLSGCLAAWFLYRLLPRLDRMSRNMQKAYRASYHYQLRKLRDVLRSGGEAEIYAALHVWSRNLGYRTLSDWTDAAPDEVKHQIELLSRRLFSSDTKEIDRKTLSAKLNFDRKTGPGIAVSVLPPLNP